MKRYPFEQAGDTFTAQYDNGGKAAPVLIMGHMDTVFNNPEETKQRPFTITEGKAYGPGCLDMKGGVTIGIFAFRALLAAGYNVRPFKFAFAGDEEVGHLYSNAPELIGEAAKGCVATFNMETGYPDGKIVTGRKGCLIFDIVVHGVAAHAGNDPERGRSAVLEASHKVIALQALNDYPRGLSVNVGEVTGGAVYNAVPDHCLIKVDTRFLDPAIAPEVKAKVEAIVAETHVDGTSAEITRCQMVFQAFKADEKVQKLAALYDRVAQDEGFGPMTGKTVGGGSDAPYSLLQGTPTICATGVRGAFNHSPQEYAIVESMFEKAKVLIATILRLEEM